MSGQLHSLAALPPVSIEEEGVWVVPGASMDAGSLSPIAPLLLICSVEPSLAEQKELLRKHYLILKFWEL